MKIWKGQISDWHYNDACKVCLFPTTCAKLDLLKEESRQCDSNKHTEIIIVYCPCREIKYDNK